MSLLHHYNKNIHDFFADKEMNEIYLSYGISNLAIGMISIFVPIYIYKLGFSLPAVLFYYFLLPLGFVLVAYSCAKAVSKWGVKHSMLASFIILIIYLLGLRKLGDWPILYFVLPFVLSVKSALYFYSFHLNFLLHSSHGKRGGEVSMIQALASAASLLSPLIGGFIAKFFGFESLFLVGSILLLFSIIPLFFTKDSYQKIDFDRGRLFRGIFSKNNIPLAISFSGYSIENWIGYVIWPVFLYMIFTNTETVGIVSTLTASLTFVVFYLMARLTDKGDKRKLIKTGSFLNSISWVGRFFVNGFFSVVLVDTFKNLSGSILQVPWSAYTYDIASTQNQFKFIVRREITFNLSRLFVVPLIILIFIIDFHPFTLSFSLAAIFSLLYMSINRIKPAVIEKVK